MSSRQSRSTVAVKLKVAEGLAKDMGRGIARLDPKDMERLAVGVGDIICITGKKKTVAKVMPAFVEDRGHSTVHVDGIVRHNAGAGISDKVQVAGVTAAIARKIVLSPVSGRTGGRTPGGDSRYLGRVLEGLPVMQGDRIRALLFGSSSREFSVVRTSPEGPVLMGSETAMVVEGQAEGKPGVAQTKVLSYEDIGGLAKEIRKIREMIELPMRHPEVFERLGIQPPKGVLLHGPPGTGKTLIARAVASETDATFLVLNGPEIMAKYYGESEGKLRSLFEEASKNAPAIIFLDEIDAIAPKRLEMGGEKQVERRVVAQLLALMDGLEGRGEVIVIGASNVPDTIDPALRRPGRFDREIEIGIPDANGRLEVLHVHTRGMPLADDVQLKRMAELTHGYVGADLEALAREAAMACLRNVFPTMDAMTASIPYERILQLEVRQAHFMEALREIQPSAIREVFVEVPNVAWDDVGGLEETKKELVEAVEWPLKYGDLYEATNTRPPKGILLHGPPGTGKTLLAKALAHESEVNFISVKGPELLSKWVGDSEKGIREIFHKARQAAPCILFFDEIDSMAPIRGQSADSKVTERVVSQFLTELDGLEELKGVFVLAATNRVDIIDPALLRSGRFDLVLELPHPDLAACEAILKIHTKGKPLAKGVSLPDLAAQANGLSGADVAAVCQLASLRAVRSFVERLDKGKPRDLKLLKISKRHFEQAFADVR